MTIHMIRKLATLTCLLAALSAAVATDARAQAKVGTTGFQSLELDVSARGIGMGGAFSAAVDDISAVHYNPAALPYLVSKEVLFTRVNMPADVNMNFFAFGMPVEAIGGTVAFAARYLGSGDILRTTYGRPFGEDQFGNKQYFSASQMALSMSYGRYLTDRFSVGITLKYLNEGLETSGASGWAADVGTLYNTGFRNFRVAMNITNFGPDMRHIEKDYPLPIDFRFGAAINFIESQDHLAVFSMEGSHPSDNLEKYRVGGEYWYNDMFALRGGLRFNYDIDADFEFAGGGIQRSGGIGFAAGGGIKAPLGAERELRIDYAFEDYKILSEVHRLTLGIVF